MKKLKLPNILANQFYNPALVKRTLLFASKYLFYISVNYDSFLKARIVDSPEIVDIKPATTGELVLFSYLQTSR